jgi:regulator of sigma E protease
MLLYVAGILSANLAVVNILPFPPLDGGRMLMITLKRLFGARISLRAEQLTYVVGFVFLFAFIHLGDRLRHHPQPRLVASR